MAKAGLLFAPLNDVLLAEIEFVLEDQFQELLVRQLMSAGFLQPELQAGQQAGKPQFSGVTNEVWIHEF